MTFSLSISHTPWRPDRVVALREMMMVLTPLAHGIPFFLNDVDYRGKDWQQAKVTWALDQWRWHLSTSATHHVLMTDDLAIAPGFWMALDAMVTACPNGAIGLLSNHPAGPRLVAEGYRWYRCGCWIVGPAYVVPRETLDGFVKWYEALPDGPHNQEGTKAYRNDDSSLNEFLSQTRRNSYHPLPTIVEHRGDLPSTVGHGDKYSRERLSWRQVQKTYDDPAEPKGFAWKAMAVAFDLVAMARPNYWREKGGPEEAPLLSVGNPEDA
jgi:hypothetical protein